ncbi:putative protein phosphatase 1 regulatory inhibitor subunit PPP1R8 [Cocos nucifera]|uniref:FHA domain-containing protein n=1 Tax=Cocos nucifera TaxID=13894 RepID=A0A8K0IPV2_COCNU|nr:putative protein phosphatase 1 regulatory inhibitor subunit PPP1R8 [Cocos nucifera]
MYRGGLDRFKKAQSLEPFSVNLNSVSKTTLAPKAANPLVQSLQLQNSQITHTQHQQHVPLKPTGPEAAVPAPQATQVGGGQSTWQPPDWAIEPRPGVYYLEVLKDREVIGEINLDKRWHIFGRQFATCDFVLDHQSVSRQHAAVVPHKNGSIYVIDLGSVHGTFVANERLTKDNPVKLEVGQSLRFAASTRSYILRKNTAALFPNPALPAEINLPSPPDPSDEDAVVAYNTVLNRYGCISQLDFSSTSQKSSGSLSSGTDDHHLSGRSTKRIRQARVAFKDQVGGYLVEVVGISDGADVETEPGPIGVKEVSKTTLAPKAANPLVQSLQLQNSQITHTQHQQHVPLKPTGPEAAVPAPQATQVGGGQSTWQPPDWAIEPRPGVYYLEVLKDREVIGEINLDKRWHIFGRQFATCDFVLDHQSVSRQHAAVVPHKNGSIYVIDLGSVHGTFVANERLTKDNPVKLEVGQSLRFAASTRSYILRKNTAALFPNPALPAEINLPSPPDPSDEDAVVAYNTVLNRYGCISQLDFSSTSQKSSGSLSSGTDDHHLSGRSTKRIRQARVAFKDQVGGYLVEVVGISDGADVETEPGPIGVKEGSLVGKYESLVQITVIPKGKEQVSPREDSTSPKGVTDKLQQVLNKVKSTTKSGIYDDLYGDSFSGKVGSSWAYKPDEQAGSTKSIEEKPVSSAGGKNNVSSADDSDDLFGDY